MSEEPIKKRFIKEPPVKRLIKLTDPIAIDDILTYFDDHPEVCDMYQHQYCDVNGEECYASEGYTYHDLANNCWTMCPSAREIRRIFNSLINNSSIVDELYQFIAEVNEARHPYDELKERCKNPYRRPKN